MSASPRLHSLIVELTQRCNHACLHCYNVWQGEPPGSSPRYPRGQLDTASTLDVLAKVLDETGCRHVTLTGGEPLLREDLSDILSFLRARDVRITLISNGRLLTADRVAALVDQGIDLFELPLLSSTRGLHDHLSASPGAWDGVLSAMANIRSRRGCFVAAFVGTRFNMDDLHATIRLAFAFGARAFMFNRFNPGGRGRVYMPELLPSVAQLKDALAVAEAASLEFGLPISCSIPIQPCLIDASRYPHLGFGSCAAGTERAYYTIDPLGNLRPCNHAPLILGNLLETSFAEIISSQKTCDFINSTPLSCSVCELRSSCQGGCKAAALACYSSLEVEEPFLASSRLH